VPLPEGGYVLAALMAVQRGHRFDAAHRQLAGRFEFILLQWHALHSGTRLTANQLRHSAEDEIGGDPWNGCFPTNANGRLPTVKSLGRRLTGQVGRWRGDIVLRSANDPATNAHTYWVTRQADDH
jgi:hypothetical protein